MMTSTAPSATPSTATQDKTFIVDIKDIVKSPAYQVRPGLHEPTVRRYRELYRSGTAMEPIVVARVAPHGRLVLIDGWHRMAAQERIGGTSVTAVVRDVASVNEAKWMAADANAKHGRPLCNKGYRKRFRIYVQTGHNKSDGGFKSYRQIASEVGKPAMTIIRWMALDFPKVARQMKDESYAPFPTEEEEDPEEAAQYACEASALKHIQEALSVAQGAGRREAIARAFQEAAEVVMRVAPVARLVPTDNPEF